MQLAYGSLEEVDIIGPSPLASARLELARTLLRGETPLATVASLSFVNYGGKFRLEWMSTSERAECFCFVWQLSQTRYVGCSDACEASIVNH